MKRLLSTRMARQLTIVELIYENDDWTVTDIAKQLQVPAKTIKSDLAEIHTLLPAGTFEHQKKSGVIQLSSQNAFSKALAFQYFLSGSIELQLIEAIFSHRFNTISELAETLYTSVSTVKRLVSKLNKFLELEGFRVSLKKMELLGDPQHICHFMKYYFLEKYAVAESLLSQQQILLLDKVLHSLMAEMIPNFSIDPINFVLKNQLRMCAYTVIQLLTKNPSNHLPSGPRKNFAIVKDRYICDEFFAQFHFQLTAATVSDVLFLFFGAAHARTFADIHKQTAGNLQKKQKYDKLLTLLQQLEKQTGCSCPDFDQLFLRLYNLDSHIHGKTYVLYDQNKDFYVRLERSYGTIIQEWLHSLQVIFYFSLHKDAIVYEAIRLIFTYYSNLLNYLEQHRPKMKIGAFFAAHPAYSAALSEKINRLFRERYHCQPIYVNYLKELPQAVASLDCLITNIPALKLADIPILVVPLLPDANSFEQLTVFYENFLVNYQKGEEK